MNARATQIIRTFAGSGLVALGSISIAAAQVQPNPPSGFTVTGGTSIPTPPPGGAMFFDDFNYVVNKYDPSETKMARFLTVGWSTIKDEQTQPGRANGYLYTRTSAPGCGPAPSGRMLTMEGLGGSLGGQTDFYLQLGNGQAGDIPARLYVQFDLCLSRDGVEMSNYDGVRDKFLYPLFGSRNGYPMAADDTAWLHGLSSYVYDGSTMVPAPEPGAFTFVTGSNPGPHGPRALVSNQVGSGSGSSMTANVGDPWIRPNRWYTVRFLFDVSGAQGVLRVWIANLGQPLRLVTDYTGGVTPGFSYVTAPLDRLGAKFLRLPSTWGTVSGVGQDRWLNIDNIRLASSEGALN